MGLSSAHSHKSLFLALDVRIGQQKERIGVANFIFRFKVKESVCFQGTEISFLSGHRDHFSFWAQKCGIKVAVIFNTYAQRSIMIATSMSYFKIALSDVLEGVVLKILSGGKLPDHHPSPFPLPNTFLFYVMHWWACVPPF